MKLFFQLFVIMLFASFLMGCMQQAGTSGEVPITASTSKVRQLVIDGRNLSEDLEGYKAAELFDQAIAQDPNCALAYLYRSTAGGGYEVFRSNLGKAVALVDKVSEGEKHLILFNQAQADGDGAAEKMQLDKLLELYPNDKRVQFTSGNYHQFTLNDYQGALRFYEKAIALDKDYAPVYNILGYNQMSLDNYAAAEEAFKNYIRLVPDKPNPYDSYAEMLLKQGKFDESIKQYQKSYDTDNTFVLALTGIADNYVFKGDCDKAREYYQQFHDNAQTVNQKMGALSLLALSYVHEANTEMAVKTLDSRAEQGEENKMPNTVISSYNQAAFILTEAGELDAAGKYYAMVDEVIKSAEMDEKDRASFKFNAGVNRCYRLSTTDDFAAADAEAEMCKKVASERKNPGEMRFLENTLGVLATKKGNLDQALEHFAKGAPQSPYNWFCMAVAHEKKGNKEEAAKLYSKISGWNTNGLGLAVVRARAMKKANM